jgi:ferric-dicitrate binding protein FerR (iron transport regulator)
MKTVTDLDMLLNALVDGVLDVETTVQLQTMLQASADARRRYRDIVAMHASLHWDYVATVRDQAQAPAQKSHRNKSATKRWWLPLVSATAASVLLIIALWLSQAPAERVTLTVAMVSGGNLSWSNDSAAARTVHDKEVLSVGRFALEGDGATAMLRFDDGTVLTLTGDTELVVAAGSQKNLHLMRGIMAANVQPQDPSLPLLIRTATAQLTVVGTRFIVASTEAGTALDVEHGRIQVERLADGQAVEVATQQTATITLDVGEALRSTNRQRPPTSWQATFTQQPPAHWRGTWVAPTATSSGFLRATPYVAGRTAEDKPIIHHGMYFRAQEAWSRPFVRFVTESRVTMRFRVAPTQTKGRISVMVCTHTASGAFGGTFFAPIQVADYPADSDGWRTISLPVSSFGPTRPTVFPALIDRDAIFILPHAVSEKMGLEVAELTVVTP